MLGLQLHPWVSVLLAMLVLYAEVMHRPVQVAVTSPHNAAEISEIAACLEETAASGRSVVAPPAVDGTLYCYLPLPFTATGLPLHVHASWALASNRRELWSNIDDARKLVRGPGPFLQFPIVHMQCVV